MAAAAERVVAVDVPWSGPWDAVAAVAAEQGADLRLVDRRIGLISFGNVPRRLVELLAPFGVGSHHSCGGAVCSCRSTRLAEPCDNGSEPPRLRSNARLLRFAELGRRPGRFPSKSSPRFVVTTLTRGVRRIYYRLKDQIIDQKRGKAFGRGSGSETAQGGLMSSSRPNDPIDPASVIGPMSRRGLFRKGAGLAVLGMTPALLAACGSDSDSGSSSASSTSSAPAQIGGTVQFFGYQGDDFPEVLKSFNQKNGIKIESSYIGSMSDIPAKFAGGGSTGIDIINWSAPGTLRLSQSGVPFQPLDLEKIPNWKNVEQFIEYTGPEPYSNEAGEIVGAPLAFGSLGITYDSAVVEEPKGWEDLLQPAFKGKITTVDDPSTNYALAASILGFNSAELTQDQLEPVNDYLKRVLVNCKKLSPTFGDMSGLLASGEISAAFGGWSAINAFAAESGNKNIKTNLEPEEGSAVFVEMWGLPDGASNPDTVYALINQLLDTKVNADAASSLLEAPTATGAQKLQPKSLTALYPPENTLKEYFTRTAVAQDPPAISDEFVTFGEVTEEWNRLKTEV